MIPRPSFLAPVLFQLLCGDINHGNSTQGGVMYTVVYGSRGAPVGNPQIARKYLLAMAAITGISRDTRNAQKPVSYTHLTLPTILRV